MSMILHLRRATSEDVARLEADAEELVPFIFEDDEGEVIDFDKAWHVLHFMLCGDMGRTSNPLSVLLGNDEGLRGTEAHFYGFWVISPEEVRAFDGALSSVSDADIASRYNPQAFAAHNLYGADIFADEGDAALLYVMQAVPPLRALARAVA